MQATDNDGAIPSSLTISAPSYAVPSTSLPVKISYSDYSPPPPPPSPPDATPSKCGGAKASVWLGIVSGILSIGAAIVTGGAHMCGEVYRSVRMCDQTCSVCGPGPSVRPLAGSHRSKREARVCTLSHPHSRTPHSFTHSR